MAGGQRKSGGKRSGCQGEMLIAPLHGLQGRREEEILTVVWRDFFLRKKTHSLLCVVRFRLPGGSQVKKIIDVVKEESA